MKNRPPNVFVSSTMYDLSELRAQLGQLVDRLGWRAIMSEHDSFPIDPDQTTVENSRRNVRQNADIFVMVVGARYGSIDVGTDKSVTNLEFVDARACGVPVYVFVNSDVLAQLQVWKANPEGDYTSIVDTPRIFEFIDSFRGDGQVWTFRFNTAEGIVKTLRQQFAYLAQDALELRQMARGQDRLLEELKGDALMLALQRGDHWEARLFATILEEELDRRTTLRREIEYGLASENVTFVDTVDLEPWMQDRLREAERLLETATAIVKDYLPQAMGEDGVPGDPIQLANVARRLAQVWDDNARWTLRCRAVRVDDRAERFVHLVSNLNANILEELWEFGHTIIPRLNEAIRAPSSDGDVRLDLTLTLTVDTDELSEEIGRLGNALFE